MEIEKFIENYREAFGEAAGLPVVFWYSDEETGHTEKIGTEPEHITMTCLKQELSSLRLRTLPRM